MQQIIIACHVMGQSVIKSPANAVSSEEGAVAVGWSWSGSVKREMDRR